jgi:abequosyltransferase
MQKLISLCVTTRNRKESLGRLINELSPELSDEVDLIIVDGASTDGTQNFIEKNYKNSPYIRYFCEEINSGLDQGYDQCVSLASGKYCWLLSDDDQIVQGSLELLIKIIKSNDYDLIVANSAVWDSTLQHCLIDKQININQDTNFTSRQMEELFVMTASVLSFIGAVIIKRELWITRDRESYFGSWFAHVGVIFQKKLDKGALVIERPLVNIRYGLASWSDKAFDIWMKSWPNLIWSLSGINENAKKAVVPRFPGRSFLRHLLYNCHNINFQTAQSTIPPRDYLRRIIIKLIYLIPSKVCNAIVGVACYLTSKKRLLILYDVANCASKNLVTRYLISRVISHKKN